MSLWIGRISSDTRTKDLEDLFGKYGRILRCDVKRGFAFVEFQDDRDAEDALRDLDGYDLLGHRIVVEWARGRRRGPSERDKCFRCGREGHWARDCRHSPVRRRRGSSHSRSPRRRHSSSRRRSDSGRRRSKSRSHSRSRSPRKSRSKSPRKTSPKPRSRSPKKSHSPSPTPRRTSASPHRKGNDSPIRENEKPKDILEANDLKVKNDTEKSGGNESS